MRARSQSLIGLLAAFAGLLIVAVPAAALAGWSSPTQVYDGNFSDSSLAVDAHGHAHIAARGDTGIWYLTNKGGSWTRRRLTTDVWGVYRGNPYLKKTDTSPAISVDRSTDAIVVAYRHYEADPGGAGGCGGEVRFTRKAIHGWSDPRTVNGCGVDPSVVARHGDIAIAFLSAGPPGGETQTLEFVRKSDGWALHPVAGGGEGNGSIGPGSLALDSNGRPRIAYQRNGFIKLATGATTHGDFTREQVAPLPGHANPSLALNANDRAMIVWSVPDGTHYARRDAGVWYSSRVMPGHLDARLTLDSHGAHVVAADGANGLWYGTGTTSANWTFHRLLNVSVSGLGGIGVAPGGRIEIAYERGHANPRVWFIHTTG